ncbi:hypothetical protein [Microbulbifer sp. JTAC008]|uniref:hypothetical protein n=1 Tax=unclassified Microbulbifer TaxID=2619833 RepID=UPI004039C742
MCKKLSIKTGLTILASAITLMGCTSAQEKEAMQKIVFSNAEAIEECVLVEDVTCKTIRVNQGDVCTPWLQKRAVRRGGTHVVKASSMAQFGDIYMPNGVSAGKTVTGTHIPAKIYNCSASSE